EPAIHLLGRVLASVQNGDVRKWVANLRGWSEDGHTHHSSTHTGSFLRCRLIGSRWERKWTSNPTQPEDGFLLPDSLHPEAVASPCEAYKGLDEDGRHLIRLIAAAALSS